MASRWGMSREMSALVNAAAVLVAKVGGWEWGGGEVDDVIVHDDDVTVPEVAVDEAFVVFPFV